jgi:hypothetical protein
VTVVALPPDFLNALSPEEPVGVYDPEGKLSPVLEQAKVKFTPLPEKPADDSFTGHLILFRPAATAAGPALVADRVRAAAKRGLTVVWLLPHPSAPALASFERIGAGAVIRLDQRNFDHLATSADEQWHFAEAARLLLRPDLIP